MLYDDRLLDQVVANKPQCNAAKQQGTRKPQHNAAKQQGTRTHSDYEQFYILILIFFINCFYIVRIHLKNLQLIHILVESALERKSKSMSVHAFVRERVHA
jgi:hypothetical protein